MKIWVDADACPAPVKAVLFRAAQRLDIPTVLVANHPMAVPKSSLISLLQVPSGFDVADNEILRRLEAGDLVITADIPLAAGVIDGGGHALNPRGELYTTDTIRERLSMRDFMDSLRASGVQTGGPSALHARDVQAFANALDRFLARHHRPAP